MLPYAGDAHCWICDLPIDEDRAVETNYLHGAPGKPGGPQDWYACGGCLTAFRVTWEAIKSIGDDGWAMFATDEVLLTGATVKQHIERLRDRIAAGESRRALEELSSAPRAELLLEIPEVVEAAWPAFGGRAIAAMPLGFSVTTLPTGPLHRGIAHLPDWRVTDPVTRLRPLEPEELTALLREPEHAGVRKPGRLPQPHAEGLVSAGAKLSVVGSGGPFVHVTVPLWNDAGPFRHFQVTLPRITFDPDAP